MLKTIFRKPLGALTKAPPLNYIAPEYLSTKALNFVPKYNYSRKNFDELVKKAK